MYVPVQRLDFDAGIGCALDDICCCYRARQVCSEMQAGDGSNSRQSVRAMARQRVVQRVMALSIDLAHPADVPRQMPIADEGGERILR